MDGGGESEGKMCLWAFKRGNVDSLRKENSECSEHVTWMIISRCLLLTLGANVSIRPRWDIR
jgi:hypothetical protein